MLKNTTSELYNPTGFFAAEKWAEKQKSPKSPCASSSGTGLKSSLTKEGLFEKTLKHGKKGIFQETH